MDSAELSTLESLARATASHAYCPYSRFNVGAAIRATSGRVYSGCNVENASYGLTCCAERNAVFAMVAGGDHSFEAIAIYTPTKTATAPCGACRQVLFEFGPEASVVSVCDSEDRLDTSIPELLPKAFGPANL